MLYGEYACLLVIRIISNHLSRGRQSTWAGDSTDNDNK